MVGGTVLRVIHLGPEGMGLDQEDQKPIFPNTIKLIVEEYKGEVRPPPHGRCAVHVAPTNYEIEVGDKVWWQGETVYWAKPMSSRSEIKLQKIGFTYSGDLLDQPKGEEKP